MSDSCFAIGYNGFFKYQNESSINTLNFVVAMNPSKSNIKLIIFDEANITSISIIQNITKGTVDKKHQIIPK